MQGEAGAVGMGGGEEMTELKPCPHCDGEAQVLKLWEDKFYIACSCGAEQHSPEGKKDALIKGWNARVDNEKEKLFVQHIQDHLATNEEVMCRICGKTIDEIWEEK